MLRENHLLINMKNNKMNKMNIFKKFQKLLKPKNKNIIAKFKNSS